MVGQARRIAPAFLCEDLLVLLGDAGVGDEHALDTGGHFPGSRPFGGQHLLAEEGLKARTLGILGIHLEIQERRHVVVAEEHLGGVRLDQGDAACRVRTPIDEVPGVDEGVPPGLEASVAKGVLDELRVSVSIRYDERAHQLTLLQAAFLGKTDSWMSSCCHARLVPEALGRLGQIQTDEITAPEDHRSHRVRRVTLPHHAGKIVHPRRLAMIMEDAVLTEGDFED